MKNAGRLIVRSSVTDLIRLLQIPFCRNSTSVARVVLPSYDCNVAVGYMAVYRLCFALCLFFVLMAVIMIGVKSSKDGRAPIQNG